MDFISSAVSALNAYRGVLDSKANNVANAQTPGYQAETTTLREREGGGVELTVGRDERPGPPLVEGNADAVGEARAAEAAPLEARRVAEGSNVDLATELVDMRQAQLAFEANANVLRHGLDTLGSFIDEFA